MGTLGTARAWSLLRHHLDPTKSKLQTSHTLRKIVRDFEGTDDEILRILNHRYIDKPVSAVDPDYYGRANPELDMPLTEEEVTRAAQDLTGTPRPAGTLYGTGS